MSALSIDLPELPYGVSWLLCTRAEHFSTGVGDVPPEWGEDWSAEMPLGTHLVASDRSAMVPVPEPLCSIVRRDWLAADCLLERLKSGAWGDTAWPDQASRQILAARDDDFIACVTTGATASATTPGAPPSAHWHDSPELIGQRGPRKGEPGYLPTDFGDALDAAMATGRDDVGLIVQRRDGRTEVDVMSTADALARFCRERHAWMSRSPWPQLLEERAQLEEAPATIDGPSLKVVPFDVELNMDEDTCDIADEIAVLGEPLFLPPLKGALQTWIRRNTNPYADVDWIYDILLLGEADSRSPEEAFQELASQSLRLGDFSSKTSGVTFGPSPSPVEEGLLPVEYSEHGPLDEVAGVPALIIGAYGDEIRIACDGDSLLIGTYELAGLHGLLAEWVRGKQGAPAPEPEQLGVHRSTVEAISDGGRGYESSVDVTSKHSRGVLRRLFGRREHP